LNFNSTTNTTTNNPFQLDFNSQELDQKQKQFHDETIDNDDNIYDEPCIRCGCNNSNAIFQLNRVHNLGKIDLCLSCFIDIQRAKVLDHRLPKLWIVAKTLIINNQPQQLGRVAFNSIDDFNHFCKNLQNSQCYQYGVYIKSENWPMRLNWLRGDDSEDIPELNYKFLNIFWLPSNEKNDYKKILEAFDFSIIDDDENKLRDILFDVYRTTYVTDSFFDHCEDYIKNVQTNYDKFKTMAIIKLLENNNNNNNITKTKPFNFTMTD
jgi:hypothetical protein